MENTGKRRCKTVSNIFLQSVLRFVFRYFNFRHFPLFSDKFDWLRQRFRHFPANWFPFRVQFPAKFCMLSALPITLASGVWGLLSCLGSGVTALSLHPSPEQNNPFDKQTAWQHTTYLTSFAPVHKDSWLEIRSLVSGRTASAQRLLVEDPDPFKETQQEINT